MSAVTIDNARMFSQRMSKNRILAKISRESNRLKYRSSSGSGSRNSIFNSSVPVQVKDFSKIWVQVVFRFSCTKI